MKTRKLFLVSAVLVSASAISAQRVEMYGDYSYIQFNPTINGLTSRAFNGGGGGVQFNMGKFFGLKADFQGYASTDWTLKVSAPIGVTINGSTRIIPAGTYITSGSMFTYMFGPVVKVPAKKVSIFGELLFGQSNTNGYANLTDAIVAGGGTIYKGTTQHPFTMAFGGGFDVNLNKKVALRLGELDYLITRYHNPLTGDNNQNNFRYVGGIIFKFGGD